MKKKKKGTKISNVIRIIVIITIFLLSLFLLPDLIYNIRFFLLKVGFLNKIAVPDLVDERYISMMLTIFSCCTTGAISFIAYRLSKILGAVELDGQKAKQSLWALNLLRNIEYNSEIIFKMSKDIRNELYNLRCEKTVLEAILNLYSSHIINKEEKKICSDYQMLIENIYSANKMTNSKGEHDNYKKKLLDQINEYCKEYLKNSDILKYSDKLKPIMNKLENVIEGEDDDV